MALAGCTEQTTAPATLKLGSSFHVSGPRPAAPVDPRPVADFSLPDVNPNSATHDQALGPRRYLNQVSAWYFGHST